MSHPSLLPPSASATPHTASPTPPSTSTDSVPPSTNLQALSAPSAEPKSASPSAKLSRTPSPPRPPVSPLTPTAKLASLAPITTSAESVSPRDARIADMGGSTTRPPDRPTPPKVEWITQPSAAPLDESENPDVLALKAAISILQIQRAKAQQDMQSLARLRDRAVDDPGEFARALQERARNGPQDEDSLLEPTLAGWTGEMATESGDATMAGAEENGKRPSSGAAQPEQSAFPDLPRPQNIVRCPAINWSKYGIVGSTLDKMHAEQLARPILGEPIPMPPADLSSPNAAAASKASQRSSFATPGAVSAPQSETVSTTPLSSSGHDFSKGAHPLLKQQFDFFGRAPVHVLAAPVDPLEPAEQDRVGMRVGGWGNVAPNALHGAHPSGKSTAKDGRRPSKKGS